MTGLKNEYPAVVNAGKIGYGGNQLWSKDKTMRQCGCGVIACADTLLYICRFHTEFSRSLPADLMNDRPVEQHQYEGLLAALSPKYLPLIPRLGINGLTLALGLNRVFRDRNMRLQARWGIKKNSIINTARSMLEKNVPVILSVGPNFPLMLADKKVDFYERTHAGIYKKATSVRSHYVVVTGIDDEWFRISSWGREYYLSISEYMQYIDRTSSPLFSNMVIINTR